jgi:glycosyltransferase involved in cell wall biosynthesis
MTGVDGATSRRVLVLNQFALPRSAPGGTRHVELFGRLTGWSASILAGRRSLLNQSEVADEGILRTVPVTRYSGNGISRIVNWLSYTVAAFLRGVARRPVDVVYGSSPHLGAAVAGLAIARVHRARFVLEVRDLWPRILLDAGMFTERSLVYRALRQLELFLYRQADAIVVLAKGSGWEIECDGIDPAKIHFLPNGAEPADFDVETSRGQLRRRYGLSGTSVVYAGAHGPANGLDLVLDAAEQLADTDVRFVLVGDGVAKADLVDRARLRGLDNVEFRDPIPKVEIPELFAAADIGLHCLADLPLFRHGVSPNKLYDYMAAGLPVVTNTPGEVAAMVDEAGAGEAVGPTEIGSAIDSLAALDPDTRAKLGDNGRAWMAEHRSRAALAASLESLLDRLVEQPARATG